MAHAIAQRAASHLMSNHSSGAARSGTKLRQGFETVMALFGGIPALWDCGHFDLRRQSRLPAD
jgi:hypothetical protein